MIDLLILYINTIICIIIYLMVFYKTINFKQFKHELKNWSIWVPIINTMLLIILIIIYIIDVCRK
jgi:hypothetical protein